MKILFSLCFSLLLLNASGTKSNAPHSGQLLVVTAKDWSTSTATLQRYYYTKENWWKTGKAISVQIGRNGLGWGIGLYTIPKNAKIIKKEGDGKAPAGIFSLKQGFGYAPYKISYPYEVYKETDHCVDDVKSKYYNKIVDSTKIKQDYTSHERMKFSKDYYKYGIVVDHNGIADGAKSKRGAGSCIFIHIKKVPTAGCTAMNEDEIKTILLWLNPEANPLLVQGVSKDIEGLMKQIKPMNL